MRTTVDLDIAADLSNLDAELAAMIAKAAPGADVEAEIGAGARLVATAGQTVASLRADFLRLTGRIVTVPPSPPPPPSPPSGPVAPDARFPKLAYSEDFNGAALPAGWEVEATSQWSPAIYRADRVSVANGALVLRGTKEGGLWVSGEVRNRNVKFSNGYWESRFRVLGGQPNWNAAFWAIGQIGGPLNWPAMGEIDFVELLTRSGGAGFAQNTMHWPSAASDNPKSPVYNAADDTAARWIQNVAAFHTYGFALLGKDARWYVDGQERFRHTLSDQARATFDANPQFLDLCLYSGTSFTGASPGDATMEVDWIRVWTP